MLNKLKGASAIGIVMAATTGLAAQAQAVDPDVACREVSVEDSVTNTATGVTTVFGTEFSLECGPDADAAGSRRMRDKSALALVCVWAGSARAPF